jgi:hypothetical protein
MSTIRGKRRVVLTATNTGSLHDPNATLRDLVRERQRKENIDFATAKKKVMQENPELARAYYERELPTRETGLVETKDQVEKQILNFYRLKHECNPEMTPEQVRRAVFAEHPELAQRYKETHG